MGKLADLIERRFGCKVYPEFMPKVEAITTTEKQILKTNPDRVSFLLLNLGTAVCYVHFKSDVSASLGVYLDKNGGFWEAPFDIYGELIGYEWWCEGTAGTNIYIVSLIGA